MPEIATPLPQLGTSYARVIGGSFPVGTLLPIERRAEGYLHCMTPQGYEVRLQYTPDHADAWIYTIVRTTFAAATYAILEERPDTWNVVYSSHSLGACRAALRDLDEWFGGSAPEPEDIRPIEDGRIALLPIGLDDETAFFRVDRTDHAPLLLQLTQRDIIALLRACCSVLDEFGQMGARL